MPDPGFSRFGKYEIQAELGRGGFGRVFRAFDPTVGRLVAIKILMSEAGADLLTRFRTEAMAAGNLRHENIVTIYEFGDENGAPFIAMEYLEGEDLQQAMGSGTRLTLLDKISIMTQVADGLDCAHRHGVVHRDVKPANIRLLPDGTVKIMDFGIARLIRDAAETRLTRQGHVIGTLLYMAPEQVMGSDTDALCDIFAFGVVFYELLAGRHPFNAPDPRSIFYKITSEDPELIRHVVPNCPETLDHVIRRLLQKDRELRYQNLRDFRVDIEPVLIELRKERSGALFTEAQKLMDEGNPERVRTLLNEAIDLDPANSPARELRDKVQVELRRRLLRPRIDTLLSKANQLLADGKYAEAVQTLENTIRLDPEDPQLHARLKEAQQQQERSCQSNQLVVDARTDVSQGSLATALQKATEAIALNPKNAEAKALLDIVQRELNIRERQRRLHEKLRKVRELLLLNSFDEAITVINALEPDQRSAPEAQELLARIVAQKTECERQERLRSELATARELLDRVQFADAVQLLVHLQSEFPGDPRVHGLLAYAQQELAAFERAQTIEKLRGDVLARAEEKKFDDAVNLLTSALAAYPGEMSIVRLRDTVLLARVSWERQQAVEHTLKHCEALADQNRFDEAFGALQETLEKYPDDVTLNSLQRKLEGDRERFRRAQAISQALEKAEAAMNEGRPEAAVAALEPSFGEFRDERLRTALAQAREAAAAKQRAEKLEQIGRDVHAYIDGRQFDRAFQTLDRASRDFPDEPSLARLREVAEAAKAAWDREQAIAAAERKAQSFRSKQQFQEALEVVRASLEQFPDSDRLVRLETDLRQQREQQLRAEAVRSALKKSEELLKRDEPAAAVELLRGVLDRYPGETTITGPLARAEESLLAWQRSQDVTHAEREAREFVSAREFEQALQVVDATAARWPGVQEIDDLRAEIVTKQAAWIREQEISAATEQTIALCAEDNFAEAVRVVERALGRFPRAPSLLEAQRRAEAGWERQKRAESIRRTIREATDHLSAGDPRKALELLEAAHIRYGRDDQIQKLLARSEDELRAKVRGEAIGHARQQAHLLAEHKRFDRAIAVLDNAERLHGEDPGIATDREMLRRELAAEQERKRRADAIRAAMAAADLQLARGEPDQALSALERARADYGESPELQTALEHAREAVVVRRREKDIASATEQVAAHLGSYEFEAALSVVDGVRNNWPNEPRLAALRDRVLSAQAAWLTEQEIAAATRECERLCADQRYEEAFEVAESALDRYPGTVSLVRARDAAVAGLARQRREAEIAAAVQECERLCDDERYGDAVHAAESALARYPDADDLATARQIALEGLQRQQRDADIAAAVQQCEQFCAAEQYQDAIHVAESALAQYPDSTDLIQARDSATEALKRQQRAAEIAAAIQQCEQLSREQRYQDAVRAAESALQRYPDATDLIQARDSAIEALKQQQRAAEIAAAVQQCEQLRRGERYEDAIHAAESALQRYPDATDLIQARDSATEALKQQQRAADIAAAIRQCEQLYRGKRYEDAIHAAESALQRYPDATDLIQARDSAIEALKQQQRAADIAAAIRQCDQLYGEKRYQDALRTAESALERYPDSPELRRVRNRASEGLKQQQRAAEIAAAVQQCEQLCGAERYQDAVQAAETTLQRYPNATDLIQARDSAVEAWKQQQRAAEIAAAVRQCEQLRGEKRYHDALHAAESALERYPDSPELMQARNAAVEALERQHAAEIAAAVQQCQQLCRDARFDDALRTAKSALERYPDSPELRQVRNAAFEALERQKREAEIAAAVEQCKHLAAEENYQEALRVVDSALQRYPDTPGLVQARHAAAEGLERQKRAADIAASIARASARCDAGDPSHAVELLQTAIKRLGADAGLESALARANADANAKHRADCIAEALKRTGKQLARYRFAEALAILDAAERDYGSDPALDAARQSAVDVQARWTRERQIEQTLRSASEHYSSGRFDEAVSVVDAALRDYPGDERLTRFRDDAVAERKRRQRVQAIAAAAQEAERLLDNGNPSDAVARLQAAIAEQDAAADLRALLERAESAEVEVAARRQREAAVQAVVAQCEDLIIAGSLSEAGRTLQQALRAFPDETELVALQNRLRAEWEKQRRSEATRRAADNGRALLDQGYPRRAVQLLEAAAAQYPDDPLLQSTLAVARQAEGEQRKKEAVESACRETRLYLDQNDFDRAMKTVEINLQTWAGEPRLHELRETVIEARRSFEQRRPPEPSRSVAQAVTDEVPIAAPTREADLSGGAWPPTPPAGDVESTASEPEPDVHEVEFSPWSVAQVPLAELQNEPAEAPVAEPSRASRQPETPLPIPAPPLRNKILLGAAGAIGVLAVVLGVLIGMRALRSGAAETALTIETEPVGAAITVGEHSCTTPNCEVKLPAGSYQVSARIPGYAPASETVAVRKGEGARTRLVLTPLPTVLDVSSNFSSGTVSLDGSRVGELRDGQFRLDKVPPGTHALKISSSDGEASVNFSVGNGRVPEVDPKLGVRDTDAIVVTSLGQSAHISCSSCTGSISVDGKPAEGSSLATGGHELIARTTGGQDRKVFFRTGDAPAIAVNLNSTVSPTGTLVVETNVDGASILINHRSLGRHTESGRLVMPLEPRDYNVEVQKPGYRVTPARVLARVRKGDQVRAAFRLDPIPSRLVLSGLPEATTVLIDGNHVGTAQNGTLSVDVSPGTHRVELRKEGYKAASTQRSFPLGETVRLDETAVRLEPLPRQPAPAPTVATRPPPTAEEIQARDWDTVRAKRDPAAIEEFLKKYPNSPRRNDAQQLLAQIEWDGLNRKDRAALQRFADRYRGTPLAEQALSEIARMERETAEANQKTAQNPVVSEREEIVKALSAYGAAFDRKDFNLLKSVWPKVPEAALGRPVRDGKIRHQLRPLAEPEVSGDRATVRCTRIIEQVTQFGNREHREYAVTVVLRKEGTRWVIDEFRD